MNLILHTIIHISQNEHVCTFSLICMDIDCWDPSAHKNPLPDSMTDDREMGHRSLGHGLSPETAEIHFSQLASFKSQDQLPSTVQFAPSGDCREINRNGE